jgi:hypothetical protein
MMNIAANGRTAAIADFGESFQKESSLRMMTQSRLYHAFYDIVFDQ